MSRSVLMVVLIAVSLMYRSITQNINQNRTQYPQVKGISHCVRAILSAILKNNTQNHTQTHCAFSTAPTHSHDEPWLTTRVAQHERAAAFWTSIALLIAGALGTVALPALEPMLPANIAALLP